MSSRARVLGWPLACGQPYGAVSDGGGPALTTNILVAGNSWWPTLSANPGTLPFTTVWPRRTSPRGAVTNIRTIDLGYYISGTFVIDVPPGASHTIKRYLEYPQGTYHQVTWSGATTKVILHSGLNIYESDVTLSSITGLPLVIPPGVEARERTVITAGTGAPGTVMPATWAALSRNGGNYAGDGGNSVVTLSTSSVSGFCSYGWRGDVAYNNAKAYCIAGDSLEFGQGDVTSTDAYGNSGGMARLIGPTDVVFKVAAPGSAAFNFAGDSANAKGLYSSVCALFGITDVVMAHGGGDLRQSRTPAQIIADTQTLFDVFGPGKRKHQRTIYPRTDSIDGWITTINQTPKTDGNWAQLATLNGLIRTPASGVITVIEAADVTMTTRDSGIYKCPVGATPPTLDGVHPTSPMYTYIAANLVAP